MGKRPVSKKERQDAVRSAIQTGVVETQSDLVARLGEMGYEVTQATISRDIREMGLTKVLTPDGVYCYAQPTQPKPTGLSRFARLLQDAVREVGVAQNLVVVKTHSGSANMVAEAIDSCAWREIVGSLAGDNTIFLATRSVADAEKVKRRVDGLLN